MAATFLTSIAGIATYEILQIAHGGAIAPDWALGAWLGAGGFVGSYLGARLQHRVPETSIRRLLGLIACLAALRYIQQGVQPAPARHSVAAAKLTRTFHSSPLGLGAIWCRQDPVMT